MKPYLSKNLLRAVSWYERFGHDRTAISADGAASFETMIHALSELQRDVERWRRTANEAAAENQRLRAMKKGAAQ